MTAIFRPALVMSAAVLMASAGTAVSAATAIPAAKQAIPASSSIVVMTGYESAREWHRHHPRRYARDHVVDAPLAYVETGGHTVVDAPFTHVYVGRHGRHIVAPFVDLWVPR